MKLEIVAPDHPLRTEAQDLIRAVYAATYGAVVDAFPTSLVALRDADGHLVAAAGLRLDAFFSEAYLDAPIEAMLSAASGTVIRRDAVIEVTTLASRRAGAALPLVQGITGLCREMGMRWAFFTLTERLRASLRRWGVPLVDLAPAHPDRIAQPERWGRYYLTAPRVCAVADGMVRMAPRAERVAAHG